jgi:Predicted Zn peptidase
MPMNDRQMRQHVIGLVREVIQRHGLPPCPTWRQVFKALDLPMPKRVSLRDQDGARDGRQVFVSSRLTCPERVVFTIFHEIVHILIDEDGELPSELHDHFYHSEDEQAETRVLESLCHAGAAQFIMPQEDFLPLMRDGNWRVSELQKVIERFKCSTVAAGFQYALNHPKECILVICEHGLPPAAAARAEMRGRAIAPVLFGAYVVCSPDVQYPMHCYATVPKTHLIHQAWESGTEAVGRDHGFYNTFRTWPIPCEVTCLRGRAYAAFFPKGNVPTQHHPYQQSLF